MTAIITQFPGTDQRVEETPSALLTARVTVGVRNATITMCQHVADIAHADDRAKRVAMLMLLEVVGRAASDPNTTVNQLLQALWERVPEDVQIAAEGGR
jgi:hypothetical protein